MPKAAPRPIRPELADRLLKRGQAGLACVQAAAMALAEDAPEGDARLLRQVAAEAQGFARRLRALPALPPGHP